ncbi:MAG: hypothetical protein KBD60_04860 [Sterolibacterium sp.]|jgi:hypothetical protein|nr:hypothetical protein [Sterolibacterium sp.]
MISASCGDFNLTTIQINNLESDAAAFKTGAIDHSATLPEGGLRISQGVQDNGKRGDCKAEIDDETDGGTDV